MENYRKNSHSVYDLKLHVVWITKYRKPVLTGQTGQVLREIIRRICEELDVHLLLSFPPNLCVSKLVQKLKGVSSRKLLQSDKKLQKEYWGRHLWARG